MTKEKQIITLSRDCDALLIPSGTPIILCQGEDVEVTQALGDTVTVYVQGNLARIDGQDLDALGMTVKKPSEADMPTELSEDLMWETLKLCYDPEIPVNVVDLGLIYGCEMKKTDNNQFNIDVKMTLTAIGCGMGPILVQDVEDRLRRLPQVKDVIVELTFDPPWDQGMMSDVAKLKLGMF